MGITSTTDLEHFMRDIRRLAQCDDDTQRGEYCPDLARAMLIELTAKDERIRELEADGERLDWLDEHKEHSPYPWSDFDGDWWVISNTYKAQRLREVIDAARPRRERRDITCNI